LGLGLVGIQIDESDAQGEPIVGDNFILLLNASDEMVPFQLGGHPRLRLGTRPIDLRWHCVLDTAVEGASARTFVHQAMFPLHAHSFVILRAEILDGQAERDTAQSAP